jgi:hypothetical protein
VLPAIAAAIGLWLLLWVADLPVIGFFAGIAGALAIVFADLGMFIGAAIRGALRGGTTREAHA